MGSTRLDQKHLEQRGGAFFWRRRWPRLGTASLRDPFGNFCLVFSLRTDVPHDARILARRLTWMSDQVFAAVAEMTMSLSTEQAQEILVTLARFEIDAFERARRIAPARSPEAAALDLAREAATVDFHAELTRVGT